MGLLDSFKRGLEKTRNFMTSSINRIAAHLGYFDEDQLDELEMILVQADCGVPCATHLLSEIRDEIKRTGDWSTEAVLNTLQQGMLTVLGEDKPLQLVDNKLNVLLMIGVNGTGKTTTSGKLAQHYRRQGKRVMLCAADTFRAAAVEQLREWANRAEVPIVAQATGSDAASVVYDALRSAQARQYDLLIVDTAGRLHNKQNLMEELAKIHRVIDKSGEDHVTQALLTIDATTGQNALQQAKAFSQITSIDGIVLSKLDGNAKGGIALAVAHETKLPIKLAGLGEGIDDLQTFSREKFVESLLPNPETLQS